MLRLPPEYTSKGTLRLSLPSAVVYPCKSLGNLFKMDQQFQLICVVLTSALSFLSHSARPSCGSL